MSKRKQTRFDGVLLDRNQVLVDLSSLISCPEQRAQVVNYLEFLQEIINSGLTFLEKSEQIQRCSEICLSYVEQGKIPKGFYCSTFGSKHVDRFVDNILFGRFGYHSILIPVGGGFELDTKLNSQKYDDGLYGVFTISGVRASRDARSHFRVCINSSPTGFDYTQAMLDIPDLGIENQRRVVERFLTSPYACVTAFRLAISDNGLNDLDQLIHSLKQGHTNDLIGTLMYKVGIIDESMLTWQNKTVVLPNNSFGVVDLFEESSSSERLWRKDLDTGKFGASENRFDDLLKSVYKHVANKMYVNTQQRSLDTHNTIPLLKEVLTLTDEGVKKLKPFVETDSAKLNLLAILQTAVKNQDTSHGDPQKQILIDTHKKILGMYFSAVKRREIFGSYIERNFGSDGERLYNHLDERVDYLSSMIQTLVNIFPQYGRVITQSWLRKIPLKKVFREFAITNQSMSMASLAEKNIKYVAKFSKAVAA